MNNWQIIPEIIGCNAHLRRAVMQTMDTLEQGRHAVIEGETGSGRRLLARSAWQRRTPGARSLFTLDCHMFGGDAAEALLFGERTSAGTHAALHPERFHLAMSGGLLLLHAEELSMRAQTRLAQALDPLLCRARGTGMQLIMTCTPQPVGPLPLYPGLAAILRRVQLPALRERIEDIRPIAEAFLRNASPFEKVHCSQPLIEKFCAYDWPGNVTELRSVLRRLLLDAHNGLLDVRHLANLMCRDATCFALMQGVPPSMPMPGGLLQHTASLEDRSLQ
jgi:DNA-binding NtrC family response regulator